MKQVLHKIVSIFLAAIVLMTTMSFTVDMHFCGETLVDFSFTQQVKTCGMETNQTASSCEKVAANKSSCCTDKQVVKEGSEDLKISFVQLSLEQHVFLTAFTYTYLDRFEEIDSQETSFQDADPPFVRRDLQVLHQTFLI